MSQEPTNSSWLEPRRPCERALLRLGAVSSVLGLVLSGVASAFHGGTSPENLEIVLPQYAANDAWELVHLAQFVADVLVLVGFFALYRSIIASTDGFTATLARLAMVVAIVAEGIYGVNQAVDISNKFVAQQWLQAATAEKAHALRIANAVRHIEIGTSSVWALSGGITLLLFGLAIALGHAYPRPLGWAAIVLGLVQAALALELARQGFTASPLAMASVLIAPWTVALAICLWRKARVVNPRLNTRSP